MVRDRDQLLIGAMKRLVKRDNLCFHRFGPLVAGVERIKCFIYPLRGLVSSIIRYNILISFNSVSLRKSHTLPQERGQAVHVPGARWGSLEQQPRRTRGQSVRLVPRNLRRPDEQGGPVRLPRASERPPDLQVPGRQLPQVPSVR